MYRDQSSLSVINLIVGIQTEYRNIIFLHQNRNILLSVEIKRSIIPCDDFSRISYLFGSCAPRRRVDQNPSVSFCAL